ncbi:MAG: hypothetical protein A2V88_16225 [Elusimicrobia bacterium RBG_16_66_12]|nr:MAG: hypothetical protein A2V88_16225 [Elusimicrobia bacterium RBG_16_66_12]
MEWPLVGLAMLAAAVAGPSLFALAAAAAGAFTLAFALAAGFFSRRLLNALRRRAPAPLPPVTVIKPLKGAEAALYENLASFCRQDYPCYQLLFCLQGPEDPALAVVARLRKDFPGVDMEVVVSKSRIGYNPKVNNMANAYPFAKYDLLLMSDSDIRARPDFLRRMAAPFADPSVGLVTSFYQATGTHGLWGNLEALSINANFLPNALCAASFGLRFAMGAGMMVRRAAFEASGAYHNLADHLADDFWLGESIREAGWNLALSDAVVDTVPDIAGGAEHFRHLTRWARTIRICNPFGYAASLVQHGFSLLTLKVLLIGPDARSLGLLAGIWAAKAAASASLSLDLGGRQPLRALWLLPAAEWFGFAAWVAGCGSSRVLWRGELYDVQPHGRLVPAAVQPSAQPATVEP